MTKDGGDPRAKVRSEVLIGTFLNLGSPIAAEIMAIAGFDWVAIDLEHGSGTENQLLSQIQAISYTPALPFVRLESAERPRFARALDAGAAGVIVPRIEDREGAEAAATSCRYRGDRGVARYNRSWSWGMEGSTLADVDARTVCAVQIETLGALRDVYEIAALEGVDALFIGPSDLAHALEIEGGADHPDLLKAVEQVAAAARRHNKAAGALVPDCATATLYLDLGVTFLACSSDSALLMEEARRTADELRTKTDTALRTASKTS